MRPASNVVWNFFLALIPVVLAFVIYYGVQRDKRRDDPAHKVFWLGLMFIWLVFLPNTCYLVTEWRHFLARAPEQPGRVPGGHAR